MNDNEFNIINNQAENDRNIKREEMENDNYLEMFRSVITTGQSALKSGIGVLK